MIPLKDTVYRREFPIMTWLIILVSTAVFYYELSLPREVLEQVFYSFGVVPARYSDHGALSVSQVPLPAYLPLITSLFLHGSWLHIIGNMWFLYIFGGSVEDRIGHGRYLFFYLLCGIISGLTFVLFDLQADSPSIGASGAIAGIMGAYFILFPTARVLTLIPIIIIPFFVELPAYFFLGLWFFLQVVSETTSRLSPEISGGIAWWAHIGGFLTGAFLLLLFRKKGPLRRREHPDRALHYLK
ncbi:MAG TPA: rhomboid family intramembrane serine protease [Syntrophales bacterium]|nr:rhomboid family intramembrane serine protease [Syntrophales bacterium]HRT60792.1 rhomboid family intramembrane serine protease [Syntrophales bacterium]